MPPRTGQDVKSTFAYRLRKLREHYGFSGRSFGRFLEIADSAISQYETGKLLPRVNVLVRMCEVLETTPDELYGFAPLRELTKTPNKKRRRTGLGCGGYPARVDHERIRFGY